MGEFQASRGYTVRPWLKTENKVYKGTTKNTQGRLRVSGLALSWGSL